MRMRFRPGAPLQDLAGEDCGGCFDGEARTRCCCWCINASLPPPGTGRLGSAAISEPGLLVDASLLGPGPPVCPAMAPPPAAALAVAAVAPPPACWPCISSIPAFWCDCVASALRCDCKAEVWSCCSGPCEGLGRGGRPPADAAPPETPGWNSPRGAAAAAAAAAANSSCEGTEMSVSPWAQALGNVMLFHLGYYYVFTAAFPSAHFYRLVALHCHPHPPLTLPPFPPGEWATPRAGYPAGCP